MGLLRHGDRQHRMDEGCHRAAFKQRPEPLPELARDIDFFFYGPAAQQRADDAQSFAEHGAQVDRSIGRINLIVGSLGKPVTTTEKKRPAAVDTSPDYGLGEERIGK